MGRFRTYLAELMEIIPENEYEFLWVVDFPMFEVDDGKVKALHTHLQCQNLMKKVS